MLKVSEFSIHVEVVDQFLLHVGIVKQFLSELIACSVVRLGAVVGAKLWTLVCFWWLQEVISTWICVSVPLLGGSQSLSNIHIAEGSVAQF